MALVTIDLANAADYAIKTYGGLGALGLANTDLSATDFATSMSLMINAMSNRSIFTGIASKSSFGNLRACIVQKLSDDLGVVADDIGQIVVNIKKWYNTNYPIEIEVIDDNNLYKWSCLYDIDSGTATVSSFMETYSPNGGGGVKSVQRGTYTFSSSNTGAITISKVNPDKCMVLIDNGIVGYAAAAGSNNYTAVANGSYLVSLAATKLNISQNATFNKDGSANNYGTVSWQVIEFK